ncbi:hypothetical protein I316_04323 [Kwoniella heveanensis BCC8398]|uniref:Velvet domain-containing protein n=1 Tax=Kwoniella heveanensis BCC8398 TaxID=1296120 RepID=A0A1B9GSL3_9TREE|nr:hypothetical protein I316_04323 [Kwoniella heveanensis BCC8398]
MYSYVPLYLPPPPPGFQLVYVPPAPQSSSPSRSPSTPSCSLNDASSIHTSAGPVTPQHHVSAPTLPIPSHASLLKLVNGLTQPPPTSRREHDCVLRRYEMKMRQQPVQARMCGVGEKSDRRPVDPTPIIQLKVIDGDGEDITPTDPRARSSLHRPSPGPNGMTFMQNPYYFLFACLVGGDEQDDELHVIDDGKTRFLTGTPVSSLYHLKDLDNSDAAFFVFPDLGVRKEGRYKLKLTLFEIVDQEVYYCTTMNTSTFSVYSAKKFPGMSKASDLSKSFAEQGLKIRVRKDPRQRELHVSTAARSVKGKRKSDAAESEDDPEMQMHKRSRGMSLGYPQEDRERERERGYYRPTSSHGENPPHYPYGSSGGPPPNGYAGYPPATSGHYPPPHGHGQQRMPPPPPPSAYDPYRGSSMLHQPPPHPSSQQHPGPDYPRDYPPSSFYGSNSGRPQTHPGPSRHHQSLPPPGYGPPEHPHFHPTYPGPPPVSASGPPPPPGSYYPSPNHPDSPYDRPPSGVPWPQDRRGTYPSQEPPLSAASSRSGTYPRPTHHRHPSQQQQQQTFYPPRSRDGPRPLSPRSRVSPTRPYAPVMLSPSSSASSIYRPPSSSGRDRDRERDNLASPSVVLPPLSIATGSSTPIPRSSTPRRSMQPLISSRPGSAGGLPPIVTAAERDRDDIVNSRSASRRGSRHASPALPGSGTGSNTPLSGKTNRMGLGHLMD